MKRIEFKEIENKQLNAPCGNFWTAIAGAVLT